ncbi:MAG: (d)CMP kinase [Gammaproteobacteria bacterium]|nr:(d)CMP kinase [Gammaproteobacteria bacterium]
MNSTAIPVVTIDGPAGSGKGTIARQVAEILGYHYLDSGSLYRILALSSQQQQVENDDLEALVELCQTMLISFEVSSVDENVRVFLSNQDVSGQLRTEECAARASQLAAHPQLRSALLERQHAFRVLPGLVAEGRDMGTVVFPDSNTKIFLTASVHERATRRQKQLKKQGIGASLDHLLKEIEARDSRDENRAISPLRPAKDAVLVDSTDLSIDQVVQRIVEIVRR